MPFFVKWMPLEKELVFHLEDGNNLTIPGIIQHALSKCYCEQVTTNGNWFINWRRLASILISL